MYNLLVIYIKRICCTYEYDSCIDCYECKYYYYKDDSYKQYNQLIIKFEWF